MRRRIVLHNTYEPVTTIFRDLPKLLDEKGYLVDIVVSAAAYRRRDVSLETAFAGTGVTVRRTVPARRDPVSSRLQKSVSMSTYALLAGAGALLRSADLRIFLTQPPFFAALGGLLKRVRGERYICVLMDLYPEVLVANRVLSSDSWLGRSLERLSRYILRTADAVVVIGRDMEGVIIEKGVQPERVHYIPNWAADEDIRPVDTSANALRRELGLSSDDFVVLYSGNMGISHHFDDLLAVAFDMRDIDGLQFVFVGDGPRRADIERVRDAQGLDNIRLLDYQPATRLAESLSMGDVHFVSLREGFDGLVVPSKVFGAMAAGRSLIFQGARDSEVASMIAMHDTGLQIDIGDRAGLRRAIRTLADDPESARVRGRNARRAYLDHYSASVATARYLALIERLLTDRPATEDT